MWFILHLEQTFVFCRPAITVNGFTNDMKGGHEEHKDNHDFLIFSPRTMKKVPRI